MNYSHTPVIKMAKKKETKKNKTKELNLPASGAGLVRYFEDETKGPKLSPNQVVVMVILMGFFCIALRLSGT